MENLIIAIRIHNIPYSVRSAFFLVLISINNTAIIANNAYTIQHYTGERHETG